MTRRFLLFSGTNDRAVLALARAFSRCGSPFSIVARSPGDRILRTAFRHRVAWVRPSDSMDLDQLREAVRAVRSSAPEETLIVVPISEFLNRFFLVHRADLAELGCELPLVDAALYHALSDKEACTAIFRSAGIRTPVTFPDFREADLPIVAKPRTNVDVAGRVLYPVILDGKSALNEFRERPDRAAFFAQEFVRGDSHYLLAYVSKEGDAWLGSQLNIAQQQGGKSIVAAETARFHEHATCRRTLQLLRSRGFRGLVMVEFISDSKGPCFIELNPRPWGPLQLCLDHRCGIVEAFVGEAMHDNPHRFESHWSHRPVVGRYAWLGGFLQEWRHGRKLSWNPNRTPAWRSLLRHAMSDVYLRRDSWRSFLYDAVSP